MSLLDKAMDMAKSSAGKVALFVAGLAATTMAAGGKPVMAQEAVNPEQTPNPVTTLYNGAVNATAAFTTNALGKNGINNGTYRGAVGDSIHQVVENGNLQPAQGVIEHAATNLEDDILAPKNVEEGINEAAEEIDKTTQQFYQQLMGGGRTE